MTDREEQVRRLLADARHDEPMPADVVARLDAVLAGLAADPTARDDITADADQPDEPLAAAALRAEPDEPAGATVLPLLPRRRPWGGILLVAAAAVVVAAVGFGQIERGDGPEATAGREEAGAASDAQGGATEEGPGSTALTGPADEAESGATLASPGLPVNGSDPEASLDERYAASGGELPEIRPEHFADDVRTALELLARSSAVGPESSDAAGAAEAAPAFPCEPADWGPGTLLPVTYQGAPAVLALRPPTGESQVADLLRCGSGDVVRSVTLPVG